MKINYALTRSKRRTLSVCVTCDGSVKVSAPMRMPLSEIEKFLDEKRGWIEKKLSEKEAVAGEFSEVFLFKSILVQGETYNLILGSADEITDGTVFVRSLKNLKKAYLKAFSDNFFAEFYKICLDFGFSPKSAGFKDYKSKWGCCDGENRIFFNYKILMLPPRLQYYVAAHELCHTRRHDHSAYFWAEVKKICPDYLKLRREMKRYAFITRLY